MRETNMPKNPSFPEPIDPVYAESHLPEEQSEESEEEWQTVNFPNALNIEELEKESWEEETAKGIELSQPGEMAFCTEALQPSENSANLPQVAELVALIQHLRQRNNDLSQRVAQLENILHECQSTLKVHLERGREQENLLAERTEALFTAEAKVAHLEQEVVYLKQKSQEQQNLICNITEQLQTSQERLAQMERECALTQLRYSEQTHQLLQAEATCRDLRARLYRQQRHTLQFKAALEKCLEMPEINQYFRQPKNEDNTACNLPTIETLLLPKTEPIKPWGTPTCSQSGETAAAEPVEPSIFSPPEIAELTEDTAATSNFNSPTEAKIQIPPEQTVPTSPSPSANPTSKEASSFDKPNWPAPLVYPQQTVKKRQSLAAIELPSFPRLQ